MLEKQEIQKSNRELNMDLLRIICMISVIMIHVSGTYKDAITESNVFGKLYTDNLLFTCIFNAGGRFAVPCFFMLGGGIFYLTLEINPSLFSIKII